MIPDQIDAGRHPIDDADYIARCKEQLDREGLASQIIIGSVRHMMDVNDSLAAGAHIVTVPPPLFRKMLHHPKTDEAIAQFNDAWKNRGA